MFKTIKFYEIKGTHYVISVLTLYTTTCSISFNPENAVLFPRAFQKWPKAF